MGRNISRLLFVFLFFNTIYSQDYKRVDKIVEMYPTSFHDPLQLASKIKEDFTSEGDKARAVFTWMALNIVYDIKTYLNPRPSKSFSFKSELDKDLKLHEIRNTEIRNVFRNHKAICSGYSLLYYHLATLVGLHVQIIEGDSKIRFQDVGRKRIEKNHAWNIVMIDGTWRLVDVTWGAGAIVNDNQLWVKEFDSIYFDTDPKIFFTTHIPVSGVWNNQIIDEAFFLQAPLLYKNYFVKEVEILEPKSGVIEVKGNQKIKFKIRNVSKNQEIAYVIKNDSVRRAIPIEIEKNIQQFDVDYNKREGRFITIYVSGAAIATFKTVQKKLH